MKRRRNISSRNAAVGRHTNSIDQRCLGLEFNSPPTIYQSVPGRSAWIKLRRVNSGTAWDGACNVQHSRSVN
jgi:hypothetical protein